VSLPIPQKGEDGQQHDEEAADVLLDADGDPDDLPDSQAEDGHSHEDPDGDVPGGSAL
jgi:hypothetical protein